MEIYIIVIVIILAFAGFAYFVQAKLAELQKPADENAQKLMLNVIENLRKEINHQGGEQRRETMKTLELLEHKFSNLNKSVDGKIAENTKVLSERLDNAAKVIGAVKGELGKMSEIRGSVESLTNFLKHGKRRGNLGEEGLKEMLSDSLPKEKWKLQHAFPSGDTVDAVIETKNGMIPIDSKFPLENFEKMQQADDEKERDGFRNEFKKDVKRHIDSIGRKYIRPEEGTVDFAIMYLPAESIYNEASENAEIAKYSRSRNVQLVSPNSLFYFLRVVLIAYQSEKFEENAKKVLSLIAGVKQEATKFGEGLELTAKHLSNAKKNMDDTVAGYQKLELKIDRVGEYGDALPLLKEKEKRAKKAVSEAEDEEKLPLE